MKIFNISFSILLIILMNSFIYSNTVISGRITTTTNTPIFQAKISFVNVADTNRCFISLSDSQGNYVITITGVKSREKEILDFQLHQNYPNPFSEQTAISYSIKENSSVAVTIYDILGRKVKSFDRSYQPSGTYSVEWNGTDEYGKKVSYGIYFYRITSKQGVQTKKMVYVKPSDVGPFLSHHKFVNKTLINDENTFDETYTVYIENTDSTKPKIEPLKIENVVIQGDTVLDFQVEEAAKWEFLGLEGETIMSIATHPNDESIIYAGSSYDFSAGHMGKLFKSTNSGRTWDTLIVGQPLFFFINTVIDPFHPETVYTTPLPILKSTNGGSTWFDISNGIRIDWETRVASIAIDPKNSNILYAGTAGFFGGRFYKSTNGGESWRDLSRGDTLIEGVISIAIDPNNSNIVYAGTPMSGELWKTTDAGETWILTGLGVTNQMIDAVAVDPFNGNKVYASVRFMGFYLSHDGGVNWTKESLHDSIDVLSIVISRLVPNRIYLGTADGCFVKQNYNNKWVEFSEGLVNKFVEVIKSDTQEENLFIGLSTVTSNGGIYVRRIRN